MLETSLFSSSATQYSKQVLTFDVRHSIRLYSKGVQWCKRLTLLPPKKPQPTKAFGTPNNFLAHEDFLPSVLPKNKNKLMLERS